MKAPSRKRIEMFKKLLKLSAKSLSEGDETERACARQMKQMSAALCWAHGCGCQNAEWFETFCLELAETWEGHAVNSKGEKLDVLKALATGKDR